MGRRAASSNETGEGAASESPCGRRRRRPHRGRVSAGDRLFRRRLAVAALKGQPQRDLSLELHARALEQGQKRCGVHARRWSPRRERQARARRDRARRGAQARARVPVQRRVAPMTIHRQGLRTVRSPAGAPAGPLRRSRWPGRPVRVTRPPLAGARSTAHARKAPGHSVPRPRGRRSTRDSSVASSAGRSIIPPPSPYCHGRSLRKIRWPSSESPHGQDRDRLRRQRHNQLPP